MRTFSREDISSPSQMFWRSLREFLGLSSYEARIYEFLVSEGPSTARKISVGCGIPRTKVYCALRRLLEQNMIAEIPLNPKLFVALPPKETLKPLIDAHDKIVKGLYEIFSSLQKRYEESTRSEVIREEAWILTGSGSLRRILDLLLSAEKHVEFYFYWEVLLQLYNYFLNKVLNDLLKRGVNIYLYVPSSPSINKRLCYNISLLGLYCKVIHGLPQIQIILVDNRYIMIYPLGDRNEFSPENEWIIIYGKSLLNIFNKILLYFKEG
ncbi:MAG: helix-turn-helix domain-containing protein [Candidatus Bathyarchaeia archaeon]|nr:TrmB family transcriptional regulator [Candidatus Bathyarchaeota archaeon]